VPVEEGPEIDRARPMKKLSELPDRELAFLLNSTVAEARRLRQQWRESPDEHFSTIMNMTAEEFRQDCVSSSFSMSRLISGDVPRDVGLRFRQLQELLSQQFEFEARYPAAFEILFPRTAPYRDRAGLYLPSFGVHVLNNYPQYHVQLQADVWAGDAYTFTDNRRKEHPWGAKVERRLRFPDYEDLQGILLAILSREEYVERVGYVRTPRQFELFDHHKVPEAAYVRLTDLRLAKHLRGGSLKRRLQPLLALLEPPVTKDHVLEWKLRALGSRLEQPPILDWQVTPRAEKSEDSAHLPTEEPTKEMVSLAGNGSLPVSGTNFNPRPAQVEVLRQQFGDEEMGSIAVSFSAAALLLLTDLDMPGLREAPPRRMAEHIQSLADVIKDLTEGLNRATDRLEMLASNRSPGRQPDIEGNDYRALCLYRMGRGLRETAEWLGITPYSSRTGQGTRDWKARVRQRLRNGKRIEEERYPRAAAIFAHRDNPHVRRKARRAYRKYVVERGRRGASFRWTGFGYYIRTSRTATQRSIEVNHAYVQLGSCILQDLPPVP
jgi:hypothetical protein